ncbi:FecCD family ABC transporter permease [Priestia filamentosa]|uniref:Iron ABC transporter n=1 Tax=Priestia filamentosa TaxID=1402861 RepID=A0A0H4KLZ5_9BACI|nr:iron ABC transporter permease [Priestia filamentosa]AKO94610.1 iron ABC transporter [Priestia filamentosa]MDT3764917.1 iron ABC transporter permease [Priestia filamentosa]RJS66282.1 iron ABC transporter permease [Priestia filamentosa]WCM15511.1 iron ABC transporter permease [Priestia filamentosa]WRU95238.1 iron ABC transporter permease [Priestia filamentosa]
MNLSTPLQRSLGLFLLILLLILCMCLSVLMGYTNTGIHTVINAVSHFNGSNEQIVVRTVRIPRALIATAIGSSLAISGLLLQALTKNPLASPDIIGFNAGASFFIVIGLMLFSINSLQGFTWLAFLGAAFSGIVVYLLASAGRDGLTPMKLTLAGAAIAAMFASLTQGLLVLDEQALEQMLFWLAGSVQGRDLSLLQAVLPYLIGATAVSLFLGRKLNTLAMGEEVALGLGQRTGTVKLITAVVTILLAGGAVAVAGPIGFVGIIIPQLARFVIGNDYRWLIPYSGVLGAMLLLLADIGARYVIMPEEVPVGIMTAILGTPFFIYIARRKGEVL